MDILVEGISEAFRLLAAGDAEILHATFVTFYVTVVATLVASTLALPYGAWLGLREPRGGRLQVFVLRYAVFVPTVIVGLFVYSLLSRRGLLGDLDLLYTKQAIILGEFLLAFPILGTFAYVAASSENGRRAYETARTLGATPVRAMVTVLSESRGYLLSAWLVAVARCYAELGIVSTVGGNLRLRTRTLASTIQLELSKGEFARGMACGIVLLALALAFAVAGDVLGGKRRS